MKFPFITDGIRGDVPINFYPVSDTEKGIILLPTPGLSELCDLTDCTEIRGMYSYGNYIYVVARRGANGVLWRVDESGGFIEVGTITTSSSGHVSMVNNNTQLLIVDGVVFNSSAVSLLVLPLTIR